MPKRPRSHQLEDISRSRLHRIFAGNGWTVEDLSKDYGEDLLVRIFDHGVSTPLSFFVQAKATDNLPHFLSKRTNSFGCPVSTEHLKHWARFQEPVILTLWDSQSDETFWTCVQEAKTGHRRASPSMRMTAHIRIPCENRLDDRGLRHLRLFTLARYKRLMREAAGAKTLIDLLKSEFNIEVEYSPKNGIVSVQVPGEDRAVAFLGSTAVTLNKLCTHLKASPQKVLSDGIERLFKAHQEHDRTGKYPILNHKTGKLELKKISLRELRRHCKAEVERFDEEDEDNLDYDDRPL
jgi:hypothetical protein